MRKIVVLVIVILAGWACKKKDATGCSAAACPAIVALPPALNFNYVDTLLSRDPFWTVPRQYQFSDLKVYKLRGPLDTVFVPVLIDSASVPPRFIIQPHQLMDTIYLRVKTQKVDTLFIESRGIVNDCCLAGYIYSSIKLNKKVSCAICALPNIVEIRR